MTSSSQARRGRRASTPAPPDPSARVSVRQATGLSGVATVGVTGPDGITQTYHAHFARRAHSDEFNGTAVGPQWTWIRPDPADEPVAGGSLTITPEHADLIGNTNNARNIPRAARARELADRVEADVHHTSGCGWSSTALDTRPTTQPTARTSRRYTTPARAIKVGLFAFASAVPRSVLLS